MTLVMRSKENALDYRYFPEPDLPTVHYTPDLEKQSNNLIGETIAMKIHRYKNEYGFNKEYINGILVNTAITELFELGLQKSYDPKLLAKYIVNYVLAYITPEEISNTHTTFSSEEFFRFFDALTKDNITDNDAKAIITTYLTTRQPISSIISEVLANKTALPALDSVIQEVIQEHAKVVEEYKNGKTTAI